MMLADLGAGVVKVEALEGDSFRELPGFFGWNRGKRSIAVNLKQPDGRAIVAPARASEADVAMDNMRPGVAERLGVATSALRRAQPAPDLLARSPRSGATGPYRDRPGFDPLLQAMGGLMALQGFGGPPAVPAHRADRLLLRGAGVPGRSSPRCSRASAPAAASAWRPRCSTRVLALQSGLRRGLPGAARPCFRETPTYRLYQAGDGEWFFLACGNQSFWVKLCKALGRPELADDPRFASWLSRRDHGDALTPLLEAAFASRSRDEWLHVLAEHDIPAAPDPDPPGVHARPRGAPPRDGREYDHPEKGALTLMGQPLALLGHARRRPRAAADARRAHRRGAPRARLRRRRTSPTCGARAPCVTACRRRRGAK